MTRLRAASAPAPASEPAPGGRSTERLICAPAAILDRATLQSGIASALGTPGMDPREARAALAASVSAAYRQGRETIARAFAAEPRAGRATARAYAWLTDTVMQVIFAAAAHDLHPSPAPTRGERLALLAVGGFGRAEMAPYSDVDLLFLTPWKTTPWAESVIESVLYTGWDLHLDLGHASRSLDDCLARAKDDTSVRTALLESRFIVGDRRLAGELRRRLRSEVFADTAAEFIESKLAERAERHRRHGNFRYVVEPNVKEGKGGLRDLQSLFWIDKYLHGVDDLQLLVRRGVFTPDEFADLRAAEEFLLAVRCHLHLIAGRKEDLLTFERQIEVATRMGYTDHDGRRAVEHFMQDYFHHATRVGEMTRIFLTDLEERHVKAGPMRAPGRSRRLGPPYRLQGNRVAIADQTAFLADPLNLVRIFEVSLRSGYLLHPDAMRLIARNLALIDEPTRNSPQAAALFLGLLTRSGNPERALRRMNELGVLAAFIPEFAPIVAMMQFNMYHAFTVDEHLIQCVAILSQIEQRDLIEELPLTSDVLTTGKVNRRVLYLAVLLHDIGKGRDEDHAVLGARLARRVSQRLGLKPGEVETIDWLVRHHLLMSDVAQKRDFADPRTLRGFAKQVGTRARLDLLTALTVCDIRGVGPGIWNNWKAQLLRDLYHETARVLEEGLEAANRESRADEARRALRNRLASWDKRELKRELQRHYDPYWQGMPIDVQVVVANALRNRQSVDRGETNTPGGSGSVVAEAEPPTTAASEAALSTAAIRTGATDEATIDLQIDPQRDATRAIFVVPDATGLFARLAGAIALAGANVVDARSYTSRDRFATAVFWIQDADGHPYEAERLPRLRDLLSRSLRGEPIAPEQLQARDSARRRTRVFRQPTLITFDNEASDIYTLIEVDTRDRPGLLFDVGRTLAEANINIASAVIATYGAQAVDSFYVKDMFGLKLSRDDRQRALEQRLRAAIEAGDARAQQAGS